MRETDSQKLVPQDLRLREERASPCLQSQRLSSQAVLLEECEILTAASELRKPLVRAYGVFDHFFALSLPLGAGLGPLSPH